MKHNTKIYLCLIPITLFLILVSCKKDLSPMRIAEVILELDHVETSEVWLNLNISNTKIEQGFIIERDGQNIAEGKALGDTILIDEGLLPNHTYTYVAYLFDKIKTSPTKPVSVTTEDTTSHNFTWTIDTLGRYPSMFFDVTIIDENNIWAVGEMRTDSGYCAAAHWDGTEWNMMKFVWDSLINVTKFHSLWGESSDDFWVANGSAFHWNGSLLEMGYQVLGTQKGLTRVWGTDYSNLYFVGNGGNIIHYDGSSYRQMKSNTDIDLKRISGNDKGDVFITGYEDDGRSIALEYMDGIWKEKYYSTGIPNIANNDYGIFFSTWGGEQNTYFITLAGLLKVNIKNGMKKLTTDSDLGVYPFAEHDIEGQAENDFIIASNRGKIVHWNGYSWSIQNEMYNRYPDHILSVYGADYNDNTVAIVGTYYSGSKGFIIIGKRYI